MVVDLKSGSVVTFCYEKKNIVDHFENRVEISRLKSKIYFEKKVEMWRFHCCFKYSISCYTFSKMPCLDELVK